MKIQILWPTKCPWQKDFKRPKDFRNVTGEDYTKTKGNYRKTHIKKSTKTWLTVLRGENIAN